jgi:hypothetical protein
MKKLENLTNVTAPSVDFPYGDLKNNTGTNNGTPVNRALISDVIQFGQKLADEAGVVINDIEDNNDDGWQLYEAFRKLTKPYKVLTGLLTQSGTSAPTVTILGLNEIGTPVMAYSGVGQYTLTITSAFVVGKTTWSIATGVNGGLESFLRNTDVNSFVIDSRSGGSPTNGILSNTPFEIRVYD